MPPVAFSWKICYISKWLEITNHVNKSGNSWKTLETGHFQCGVACKKHNFRSYYGNMQLILKRRMCVTD